MKEIIKELRRTMSLSALQFSKILGVSHTSIRNWENGFSSPSPMARERIMKLKRKVEKQRNSQ